MEIVPGLRVVRGPDWKWGEQDGGEGHLGTVAEVHSPADSGNGGGAEGEGSGSSQSVTVQWDCGGRSRYRCGLDDSYDLRVFDTAQNGMKYSSVTCDDCHQDGLIGIRWKCGKCYDFDLCTSCYMNGQHDTEHVFVRYDTRGKRKILPPRLGAHKVEAKGIFVGAQVVRGRDWKWGPQDGGEGQPGTVTSIGEWSQDSTGNTYRTAVEVEWEFLKNKNEYRMGHKGKVDLKCTVPSSGGHYHPEHLLCLGAPFSPFEPYRIVTADYVKVELEVDVFRLMQEGHGGWNLIMGGLRNRLGVVHSIKDDGDLSVLYGEKKFIINPSAVVKVDIPHYLKGDVVRVMDDLMEVVKLQQDHGGWNDEMPLTIDQLGVVEGVSNQGNVLVSIKGRMWHYNPLCLKLTVDESPPEPEGGGDLLGTGERIFLQLRMNSLREEEDSEVLFYAALLGNTSVISDYLQKYPNEVNAKSDGKAAIHCAAISGRVPVLERLLEFRANLELEDDTGMRALHHSVLKNQVEAVKFLLDAGVDANPKDQSQNTPLIMAATKGHRAVVEILAKHPSIDLAAQDSDGDTALHCAIFGHSQQCVSLLLDAGADPTLINFKLINPLHLATTIGFLPAMKLIVGKCPQHINVREDQGATSLHLAAHSDHRDMVDLLMQQESCDIDARTDQLYTPLHAAAIKGYVRIIERLVGYGADLNIADSDGDTALHLTLGRDNMASPSQDTPEIVKLEEKLGQREGVSARVIVACFLIQEGAGPFARNHKGLTPLEGDCPPETAAIVMEFAAKSYNSGTFHGSLSRSLQQPSPPATVSSLNGQTKGQQVAPTSLGSSTSMTSTASLPQSSRSTEPPGATASTDTITTLLPCSTHPLQQTDTTQLTQAIADFGLLDTSQPTAGSGHPDSPVCSPKPVHIPQVTAGSGHPDSPVCSPKPVHIPQVNRNPGSSHSPQISRSPGAAQFPLVDRQPTTSQSQEQPPHDTLSSSATATPDSAEDLCTLCDNPIGVKFTPCGHSILCESCAGRAKRCPLCKTTVQAVVKST